MSDVMPKIKTWAETAAFVAKLDAVVTIDTAIGHLSAAMGIPTIMLAQYQHCWRWWSLREGSGKPWYSCMDILLQDEPGDWAEQLAVAKIRLEEMLKSGKWRSQRE
jgi:ADP-heptose:LPS heptosyltransferase